MVGDLLDHGVELGAGEGPLEWLGDGAVVLAEVHDAPGELGQAGEVVGGQRFALHDGEVDLDLVDPRGVHRQVDQPGVGVLVGHPLDRCLAGVAGAVVHDPVDGAGRADCLHEMGDPVGASAHVLETLDGDGIWMIVELFANDDLAANLNSIGRVFYGASTVICTPASLDQEVGLALGAQAGETRLRAVVIQGSRGSAARETPFNLILEARP